MCPVLRMAMGQGQGCRLVLAKFVKHHPPVATAGNQGSPRVGLKCALAKQ